MRNLLYVLLAMTTLVALQSCGDEKKGKNYNQQTTVDQDGLFFIKAGLESGLTEISAANIAKKNSKNQRVIAFADMMINDHTMIGKDLKALGNNNLVTDKDSVDILHGQMLTDLAKKTGPDFDKAYMGMMVTDHTKALNLFDDGTHNRTKGVEDVAKKYFPKIQMHLDSAKAINASLK